MDSTLREEGKVPSHVAIIMDGNGRWAREHGLERSMGHIKGAERVHQITEYAKKIGIRYLTLYTFSTENWNRPPKEIELLMDLLARNLEEETFMKNNVRFMAVGQMERLPEKLQKLIRRCAERTAANTGMTMVLALSYSSRWEMTEMVRGIAQEVQEGRLRPEDLTQETLRSHLPSSFLPDPDLMIRTGGELRLSNFLLFQSAYTELYFTQVFWPDFGPEELDKAILSYQHRQRRFGKTGEQVQNEKK